MSNLDLFTGKDKTEIAIDRLRAFCPDEGFYVAFSGGKDSCVVMEYISGWSALEILYWLHEKQAIPRRYDNARRQ